MNTQRWFNEGGVIYDENSLTVAFVYGQEEDDSDARRVAASNQMLDALKNVSDLLNSRTTDADTTRQLVHEAIVAAEDPLPRAKLVYAPEPTPLHREYMTIAAEHCEKNIGALTTIEPDAGMIPPASEPYLQILEDYWTVIQAVPADVIDPVLIGLAQNLGIEAEPLRNAYNHRKRTDEVGAVRRSPEANIDDTIERHAHSSRSDLDDSGPPI